MWGTSCLFSVCPTVWGPYLDLDQLKTEVTMGGSVCFLWGVLYKHFRTPLKAEVKMCEAILWCQGCCSLITSQLKPERHSSGGGEGNTGRRTLSFHCVTSAFRHTAAHSLLRLAYYSVQARAVLHTYLLLGCEEWKEAFILDLTSLDHTPQEMWVNIYP